MTDLYFDAISFTPDPNDPDFQRGRQAALAMGPEAFQQILQRCLVPATPEQSAKTAVRYERMANASGQTFHGAVRGEDGITRAIPLNNVCWRARFGCSAQAKIVLWTKDELPYSQEFPNLRFGIFDVCRNCEPKMLRLFKTHGTHVERRYVISDKEPRRYPRVELIGPAGTANQDPTVQEPQ